MSTTESPRQGRQTDNLGLGTVYMLLSLAGYAFNALLISRMNTPGNHASPWVAMAVRGLIGLLTVQVLAPGVLRAGWKRLFTERLMFERGFIGTLGITGFYLTLGPLGAGKATLINNSWSVFAAVMAAMMLGEPLGFFRLGGLVIALVGLGMLLGVGWDILATIHWQEATAVAGAFFSAVAVVAIRQLSATTSSALIYASQCVFCFLMGLPVALGGFHTLTAGDWAWLCGAGVAVSLAQLAMTEGFRYLNVAAGGAFQMMLPLVISGLSVWMFGEAFTSLQVAGASLLLAGSLVAVIVRK
ncbi:MAG: DMT family transporter [Verrucomicrobiaceae bacterium]|nr:DMT family transporter [Verrucomicrobiaceae bacterium]